VPTTRYLVAYKLGQCLPGPVWVQEGSKTASICSAADLGKSKLSQLDVLEIAKKVKLLAVELLKNFRGILYSVNALNFLAGEVA